MKREDIHSFIERTLKEVRLDDDTLGKVEERGILRRGKVRDIFDFGNELLIVTTDRISAFDRVLTTIPFKGAVLNQISLFWFGKTEEVIQNHILETISDRSVLVRKCAPVPIEVVVRGYLTGSAWRDYQEGKSISGMVLKEGMRFNQKFEQPLITPSTKEESGIHDRAISRREILEEGIVDESHWEEIERKSMELFERGAELAHRQGLILVDTKYEFGMYNNELYLVDEIHTPDSSRFWYADTYEELFEKGEKQNKLDKEYLRQWLMDRGFSGDGPPPHIPDEVRIEVAWKYIKAYQKIIGQIFSPIPEGADTSERDALQRRIKEHLTGR